jgi:hypothetical protein
VSQAYEILKGLPSLVNVPVPKGTKLTVCGDVHGQYFDLLNIFDINGLPSQENPYLFNGECYTSPGLHFRQMFCHGSHEHCNQLWRFLLDKTMPSR